MTVSEDREEIISLIDEAVRAGARRAKACEVAGGMHENASQMDKAGQCS